MMTVAAVFLFENSKATQIHGACTCSCLFYNDVLHRFRLDPFSAPKDIHRFPSWDCLLKLKPRSCMVSQDANQAMEKILCFVRAL